MTESLTPTYEVCIDEAGDDGMNCLSGDWMLLSGIISLRIHYGKDIELVRSVKEELRLKPRKPLHFRDLKENGKRLIISKIAAESLRIRVTSVLAHKPSFDPEIEPFAEKSKLYFYLVRFLLERVSWACRDSRSIKQKHIGDGTARITFSLRDDLSYDDLQSYFERLQQMDTSIDWNIIKPHQFRVMRNGRHPGLQLADAVASALYCCDHHYKQNLTHEWAKMLKPAIYSRNPPYGPANFRSYGVKIFPPAAETKAAQRKIAPWATDIFNF